MRYVNCVLACPITAALLLAGSPGAAADPPYPDTTGYRDAGSLEKFRVADKDGVWFVSPLGLYCGIREDGGYGCSGALPGAAPADNEVAWSPGDRFPRLYHADEARFTSGARQTILIGLTTLSYHGSTCAVTKESWVYCVNDNNPDSRILVTSLRTYPTSQSI